MDRKEIIAKLTEIIKDVLDLKELSLTEATVASDVEGWDSLSHITIISEVEEEFDMKFPMKSVIGMKNIGEMIDIIQSETE